MRSKHHGDAPARSSGREPREAAFGVADAEASRLPRPGPALVRPRPPCHADFAPPPRRVRPVASVQAQLRCRTIVRVARSGGSGQRRLRGRGDARRSDRRADRRRAVACRPRLAVKAGGVDSAVGLMGAESAGTGTASGAGASDASTGAVVSTGASAAGAGGGSGEGGLRWRCGGRVRCGRRVRCGARRARRRLGCGAGGGGAGGAGAARGGSKVSGSTYPFGSPATRMPRWTYGASCSAVPLGPIDPTATPRGRRHLSSLRSSQDGRASPHGRRASPPSRPFRSLRRCRRT